MNAKIPPSKRIELAESNLQRVNDWIANSDSKIGVVMGFQAGLTAFLTTKGEEVKRIITTQPFDLLHFILYVSLLTFAVFLIKSVFHAFKTLYPDINQRESSLFFFGSIATMGENKFRKAMSSLTEDEAEEELNAQTHINSQIAVAKFGNVKASITSTLYAALSWLTILILVSWLT